MGHRKASTLVGSSRQPSGDELTTAARQDQKSTASQDQTRQSRTDDRAGSVRGLKPAAADIAIHANIRPTDEIFAVRHDDAGQKVKRAGKPRIREGNRRAVRGPRN